MADFKKIFILGPLLLFQTILLGQDIHDPVRVDSLGVFGLKIDSLIKSGLDTFFVYYPYCYSNVYPIQRKANKEQLAEQACGLSKQSFIFYKLNGNRFVTKMNECYKFYPLRINTSPSFSYFTLHFNELIQDTIRDFSFIDKDGKTYSTSIDHSCYRAFYLSMTKKKYLFIDLYDLNETLSENRYNLNYSHNISTHINKF